MRSCSGRGVTVTHPVAALGPSRPPRLRGAPGLAAPDASRYTGAGPGPGPQCSVAHCLSPDPRTRPEANPCPATRRQTLSAWRSPGTPGLWLVFLGMRLPSPPR